MKGEMTNPDTIDAFTYLSNQVDAELRGTLGARSLPLYEMMRYHLGWDDSGNCTQINRIHGIACLTACQFFAGDTSRTLPAAAAVELVDNFLQIHDDVQAGNMTRNGRDAVWWIWGPAQAINTGDGMHALARLAMFGLRDRGISVHTTSQALHYLDDATLALCEGRFEDLEAQERIDITVGGYLAIAAGKKGSLLACACKLGALLAGGGEDILAACDSFGTKLGIAIQILEDIRQIWGTENDATTPRNEVFNKKKLLPIVYALQKAKVRDKRRLGDIFMKRVLEPADVNAVRTILDDLDARRYSESLAEDHRSQAVDALTTLSIPQDNDNSLAELACIFTEPIAPTS